MKKYYIGSDNKQSGPFTIEELKSIKITRDTLVWFEGLEDWKTAGSIPDLEALFASFPPPTKRISPPNLPQTGFEEAKGSFISENKSKIVLVSVMVVFVLVLIYSMGDKRKAEIEQRTIENTEVIETQQKRLQEQQAKIAEHERIERKRAEKERQNRIQELTRLIIEGEQRVEQAKKQVNDAGSFQFLRSSEQRNVDINTANENLEARKKELEAWVSELKQLNP
jgi:hypothetical protein